MASASIAVALIHVRMHRGLGGGDGNGSQRFAFATAPSRVYLNQHWLSDAVSRALLGTGVALAWADLVTVVRDVQPR